ncbi:hypothetical protein ACOME3_000175 [Neoechinorhynchus agilis]
MTDRRPQLKIDPRTGEYYIPSQQLRDGTWTARIVFRPARNNNEPQMSNDKMSETAMPNGNLNLNPVSQQRSSLEIHTANNRTRSVPRPNEICWANRNCCGSACLARYQPDRRQNQLMRSNSSTYSAFRSEHRNQRPTPMSAVNTAGQFSESVDQRVHLVQNNQNITSQQQPQTTGIQNVNLFPGFPAPRFAQLPLGPAVYPMPQLIANMQAISLGNQYPLNQQNAAYGFGCGDISINQIPSGFTHQSLRTPSELNGPNKTCESDKTIDEREPVKTESKNDHFPSARLYINRNNGDQEEKVPVIVELSIRAEGQSKGGLKNCSKSRNNKYLRQRHQEDSIIPSCLSTYLRPAQGKYTKNNKAKMEEASDSEDIEDIVSALEREDEMPPIPEKFIVEVHKAGKEQEIPEWFTCHNDEQCQDIYNETFMEELLLGDEEFEILTLNAETLNKNKDMAFIIKSLSNSKVDTQAVTIVDEEYSIKNENHNIHMFSVSPECKR